MKNRLETLFVILLKILILFLIGLVVGEVIVIVLDLLGYENQVKRIIDYLHL
jgi:hypothetical protein